MSFRLVFWLQLGLLTMEVPLFMEMQLGHISTNCNFVVV